MLKEEIEDFIKKQFEDLEDFVYELDVEDNYVYINFTEILGKESKKEMAFKMIDNKLQYHSISYGWKVLGRGTNIKYFWIDLLSE
jgi:hypothetical protein